MICARRGETPGHESTLLPQSKREMEESKVEEVNDAQINCFYS